MICISEIDDRVWEFDLYAISYIHAAHDPETIQTFHKYEEKSRLGKKKELRMVIS